MLVFTTATLADFDTLKEMLNSVQHWLVAQGLVQWQKAFPEYWLRTQIENQHFYLVHYQNEPVATFRLLYEDPQFWGEPDTAALYIHTLAVLRKCKGQGIGTRILDWVVQKASQEDIPFLRLDCLADNPVLVNYYARYGFVAKGKKWVNDSEYMLYELTIKNTSAK